jgi:hypothetical protein
MVRRLTELLVSDMTMSARVRKLGAVEEVGQSSSSDRLLSSPSCLDARPAGTMRSRPTVPPAGQRRWSVREPASSPS